MCIACIEYTKDTLSLNEYKSALFEMTREEQEHYKEIEKLIQQYGHDPKELKKQIEKLLNP